MIILRDTREKVHLPFGRNISLEAKALKWGDYSVRRGRTKVAVEYKGKWDWAACNYGAKSRQRLERQLVALTTHVAHPALVIHRPLPAHVLANVYSGLAYQSLYDEIYRWMERLPVQLVPDEKAAAAAIEGWLSFWRENE